MTTKTARLPKRNIERILLDNGVKVWTEEVPRSRTLAAGVWVDAGSRYEDNNQSGSTHLIQRAAFHGTQTQSGEQIAATVKGLGGEVSITTERDHAGYLARVRSEKGRATLELLADLALKPRFDHSGIAAEQPKILDELRAADSNLDCSLESLFLRSLWMGRGLCNSPQGRLLQFRTETSVFNFKPGPLQRMHRESHHSGAMTVTMSRGLVPPRRPGSRTEAVRRAQSARTDGLHVRGANQSLCRSSESAALRICDDAGSAGMRRERRGAFRGGAARGRLRRGTELRLAARIRRGGLPAEEAASQLVLLEDTGVLSVRLKADQSAAAEVLAAAIAELRALTTAAVSEEELASAKETRRSVRATVLESPMTRMRDMARQERYFSRVVDAEDEVSLMDQVTPEQIQQVAAQWIVPHKLSLSAIGQLDSCVIGADALRW